MSDADALLQDLYETLGASPDFDAWLVTIYTCPSGVNAVSVACETWVVADQFEGDTMAEALSEAVQWVRAHPEEFDIWPPPEKAERE